MTPLSHEYDAHLTGGPSGTVNRQEGVTRFTEIVLRPRLVIAAGADRGPALQILEKSEI